MLNSNLQVYYSFSFQEKYEETKNQLMAGGQEGKNKKELEEALSALSVEEQELKKQEEEFKNKEKVLNYKCLLNICLFLL